MSLGRRRFVSAMTSIKRLSTLEGASCAVMVCFSETLAITYLSKVTQSAFELGILTTLPAAFGAVVQMAVPALCAKACPSKLTKLSVCVQVLGLFALGICFLSGTLTLPALLAGLTLYWVGGMTAGAPWQEWISRLVPEAQHNSFFATRNALVSLVTLCAMLVSGVLFQGRLSTEWVGASLLAAAGVRIVSLVLLLNHPAPRRSMGAAGGHDVGFAETASGDAPHGAEASRPPLPCKGLTHAGGTRGRVKSGAFGLKTLVLLSCLLFVFRITIHVSAPYYNPYMLNELKLSLFTYTVLNALPLLVRSLMVSNWGVLLDRDRMYEGLCIALFGIALLPYLWTLSGSLEYLSMLQLASGIIWSGFELITVLLIQRMYPRKIMQSLSVFTAFGSLGGVAGALLGGALRDAGWSYFQVFVLSAFGRGAAGFLFLAALYKLGAFRFRALDLRLGLVTVLSVRPSLDLIGRFLPRPAPARSRGGVLELHSGETAQQTTSRSVPAHDAPALPSAPLAKSSGG